MINRQKSPNITKLVKSMKKQMIIALLLTMCVGLSGCQKVPRMTPDEEPSAVRYDWMAGESPVPERRVGLLRQGLINADYAVSPTGVYFMEKGGDSKGNFILYGDHGSDTLIRLCGRADCNHNDENCNAYLARGSALSYYNGYLYGVSDSGSEEECKLVRMNPDGSDHVTVLDLLGFAREKGGDYIQQETISDGILLFDIYHWVLDEDYGEDPSEQAFDGVFLQSYYFRLDGTMSQPEIANLGGLPLNDIPSGFLIWGLESKTGTEYGCVLDWDPNTNTTAYLIDHPGQPGWFDNTQAFYHSDGAVRRLDIATRTTKIMAQTGLEGDYFFFAFPDCIVLTCRNEEASDNDVIHVYNWAFEKVDSVKLASSNNTIGEDLLMAETAERLIFTDQYQGNPVYYIEKSELGTGDVQIHEFQYSH